jgi:hypothetical protein
MPLRFLPNGSVEVDTISEAVAWENRKLKIPKPVGRPRKSKPIPINGSPWQRFCADISGHECVLIRKILAIVRGRGQVGIDLHDLARAVGCKSLQVSGTLCGIEKKGEKYRLKVDDLVIRGAYKLFRPGQLLQENEPPIP